MLIKPYAKDLCTFINACHSSFLKSILGKYELIKSNDFSSQWDYIPMGKTGIKQ